MTRRRGVRLSSQAARTMLEHARRERPRECCGLLVGAGVRVTVAVPMRNLARGRTRYMVDPAGHIALQRVLRVIEPAASIVGVYHSHPRGPARPSEADVAEALYPDWIHVIIRLGGRRPETRGFTISRGRVQPLTLSR
jgi:proteasome lid subunit RPN8/RPN11